MHKKSVQRLIIILGLLIGILLAVVATSRLLSNSGEQSFQDLSTSRRSNSDASSSDQPLDEALLIGRTDAPITLIEYGDFMCPRCREYHEAAGMQLREKYVSTGRINIEFRPFPVFGEESKPALYGSYCARDQGMFEEYYDAMFAYGDNWESTQQAESEASGSEELVFTTDRLAAIASQVGMNGAQFRQCLDSPDHNEAFNAAQEAALAHEVDGTPMFVLGGEIISGVQPFEKFQQIIDQL